MTDIGRSILFQQTNIFAVNTILVYCMDLLKCSWEFSKICLISNLLRLYYLTDIFFLSGIYLMKQAYLLQIVSYPVWIHLCFPRNLQISRNSKLFQFYYLRKYTIFIYNISEYSMCLWCFPKDVAFLGVGNFGLCSSYLH